MMSVPVFEAKNRLSELLTLVESGQEIAITRRGIPVAKLVAAGVESSKIDDVAQIFDHLRALTTGLDLDGNLNAIAREGLD